MRGTCLLVLACVVGASAPARSELLRFEVAAPRGSGLPATYEGLQDLARASGLTVAWADQPYHDPNYSAQGGATYATLSLSDGSQTFTVTWIQFDVEAAAATFEQSYVSGTPSYYLAVRDGALVVLLYSDTGRPEATQGLREVLGL